MVAGYGIAIPVGAISVLLVTLAMQKGLRQGIIAALGVSTVDLTFAAVAMVAGSAVLTILAPYEEVLRIVSGTTLIVLGVYGLMKLRKLAKEEEGAGLSEGRLFLQFFILTALNPFTIVYFLALITGNGSDWNFSWQEMVWFTIGAGLASLSWQLVLVYIGATAKRFFSRRFLVATVILGNIVVMALGVQVLLSY
jgi:threonine/homoserine/homoserine lactone efflux protein